MEDRRIRKTKKAFYRALIALLRKKEIREISVQELCDLADSHRSTFYYHYQDIYALLEEMEESVLDGFASHLAASASHDYGSVYDDLLSYISKQRDVWEVLLGGKGSRDFRDRFSAIFKERYLEIWKYETGRKTFSKPFRMLAGTIVAAFMEFLSRWLKKDGGCPDEEIKAMLGDMDDAFDDLLEKYL